MVQASMTRSLEVHWAIMLSRCRCNTYFLCEYDTPVAWQKVAEDYAIISFVYLFWNQRYWVVSGRSLQRFQARYLATALSLSNPTTREVTACTVLRFQWNFRIFVRFFIRLKLVMWDYCVFAHQQLSFEVCMLVTSCFLPFISFSNFFVSLLFSLLFMTSFSFSFVFFLTFFLEHVLYCL